MNFKDISERVKSLFPSGKTIEKGLITDPSLFGTNPAKQWFDLYSENPRLSVVHKISEDNGATEYSIVSKTQRSSFYVENHPLQLEIEKHSVPNFFSLWTAYRLMKGIVYIAYDIDGGNPTNLKIFTTIHLANIDKKSGVYEFRYGDQVLKYPESQVIIDTDLDLKDPYFNGKGKAEAIKDEIETDEFVQKYIKYFYINSARPDVFITAEKGEEMSETDVQRLESEWLRKFQGVNNAHKPVFLNWAANITSVPTSHKDMELLDTRKFYRDTTIQHFGVPPEIMGIVENSNKATVIAAEHIYAKQVRMPILQHIELIVNTKLLPLYKNSANMRFVFDNIIPDDLELTLKIASEGLQARVLTVNEWRVAMGYPKIKGDYGNSIVGAKQNAGNDLPLPVEIEPNTLPARQYKEYKDVVAEEFKSRIERQLGFETDDGLVIVREKQEETNDTGRKKPN